MGTPRAAVILAEGFEEVEAVSIIDVLRRADADVTVAAAEGSGPVTGAHDITFDTDASLDDLDAESFELAALPGGMPGSSNLAKNEAVTAFVTNVWRNGGIAAAICAGPIALQAAGLLRGRQVTCYPGFEDKLEGAIPTGRTVQIDNRIVTSRGPGTALLFALELVRQLGLHEKAEELSQAMLVIPGP